MSETIERSQIEQERLEALETIIRSSIDQDAKDRFAQQVNVATHIQTIRGVLVQFNKEKPEIKLSKAQALLLLKNLEKQVAGWAKTYAKAFKEKGADEAKVVQKLISDLAKTNMQIERNLEAIITIDIAKYN